MLCWVIFNLRRLKGRDYSEDEGVEACSMLVAVKLIVEWLHQSLSTMHTVCDSNRGFQLGLQTGNLRLGKITTTDNKMQDCPSFSMKLLLYRLLVT